MLPWETTGNDGVKIPSSAWNEPSGFLVPSDHVILGFDADQKDNSKGFEISYLIEGKIPTEIEKSGWNWIFCTPQKFFINEGYLSLSI